MSKVLVVDDHPSQRRLMELTFGRTGTEVLSAPDGLTALELAGRHRPQWIFLDWEMPGLSGIDVCRELRATGSDAAIVIVSGRDSREDHATASNAGATHVLVKPVLPNDLIRLVESPGPPAERAVGHEAA